MFIAKTLLAGVLNIVAGAWGERLETSATPRAVVRSFASLRMTGFGGVISKLDLFAVNRLTGEQHLRSPMLWQICPPVIPGFD